MKSRSFTRCLLLCLAWFGITAWAQADSGIRISEFLAINNSGIKDEEGDSSDWVEIHNISGFPINTANWSLSDDNDNPGKWTLPSRTLQPDDRLLIFASDKDRAPAQSDLELHANFKLSGGGEYLGLFEPDGTVATEFTPSFPVQSADISFGYGITQSDPSLEEQPIFYLEPSSGNLAAVGLDLMSETTRREALERGQVATGLGGVAGVGFSEGDEDDDDVGVAFDHREDGAGHGHHRLAIGSR